MEISENSSEGIQLQDRDYALLQTLFESRIMTAAHVAALHFDSKPEATKKRLQKLKSAGHIGERTRRVNEKSILFLTRKGFGLLKQAGFLQNFPHFSLPSFEKRADVSALTIRHELEVMDVKAAFHTALLGASNLAVAEFSTWPQLHQFEAKRPGHDHTEVKVKPDGFIRIHETEEEGTSEHTFFLELDRSSETLETLVNRAGCYLSYYQSGGFAVRNGAPRSAYKDFPFRVLIVLKGIERRNNTAEKLLQSNPPIFTQTYLSTYAEVTSDPLGAIWIRPIDYRDALKRTGFEPAERKAVYRRQAEREKQVETVIRKMRLVESGE